MERADKLFLRHREVHLALRGDDVAVAGEHSLDAADGEDGVRGFRHQFVRRHGKLDHVVPRGEFRQRRHAFRQENAFRGDSVRIADFLFHKRQAVRVGGDEFGRMLADVDVYPVQGIAGVAFRRREHGFLHSFGKVVAVDEDGAFRAEVGDCGVVGDVEAGHLKAAHARFEFRLVVGNGDVDFFGIGAFDKGIEPGRGEEDGGRLFHALDFDGQGQADFQIRGGEGQCAVLVACEAEVLEYDARGALGDDGGDEGEGFGEWGFLDGEFHGKGHLLQRGTVMVFL